MLVVDDVNLTLRQTQRICNRDNFMSAQEALKYGLIDEIVQPNDEKLRALSMPPPGVAPQLFGELPEGAEDYEFGKIVSTVYYKHKLYIIININCTSPFVMRCTQ